MDMPKIDSAKLRKPRRGSKQIVIGIVLLLFGASILVVIGVRIHKKQKFETLFHQGIADYETCDYVNALTQFQKALNYDSTQKTETVSYLADVYIALGDYESAAELLQDYYNKTNARELYVKFEDTLELLLDFQYEKSLERGNRYFNKQEYSKALHEYLEAYGLHSDRDEIVELVVSAYIKNGQIDEAKTFYASIKGKFDTNTLDHIKAEINQASLREKYELLITEAEDFFYNGNVKESVLVYDKAISLMPYELEAYEKLVDMYVSLQQYETAMQAIRSYEVEYEFDKLKEVEEFIKDEKEAEEEISRLMAQLYALISDGKMDSVVSIMRDADYSKWIQSGQAYYFNYSEQKISAQIPLKRGLVIYSSGTIYCGAFENGKRSGEGRYFGLTEDHLGYFLYVGEWKDDLPNGEGTLNTIMDATFQGKQEEFNVIVQGSYHDGIESGNMRRDFYLEDRYFGSLEYRCKDGMPEPVDLNIESYEWTYGFSYNIGKFVTIKGTEAFNYICTRDIWQIPGL